MERREGGRGSKGKKEGRGMRRDRERREGRKEGEMREERGERKMEVGRTKEGGGRRERESRINTSQRKEYFIQVPESIRKSKGKETGSCSPALTMDKLNSPISGENDYLIVEESRAGHCYESVMCWAWNSGPQTGKAYLCSCHMDQA